LRDWVRDPLELLDCDLVRPPPWERLASCLGRLRVEALAARPRLDRDADLLAEPPREVAEELLLAARLGRELDFDDPVEAEGPSLASRLALANSMMVLRPLWRRS
jgi:hypothetical protein